MKKTYFILTIVSLFLSCFAVSAKTYFIAVNGSDTNQGTKEAPFATIMQAQKVVEAGDTVYIRGGKYLITDIQLSRRQRLNKVINFLYKSGESGKLINYWAFPGERPVFDFSQIKPENSRVMAFNVTGSWIHLKGFEVTGVQVTMLGHTQSECFHNEGSNNIYENLSMHDGQAIGFYLTDGSDNLILNCDAYRNWDYTSEGGRGGNTDGFGCHGKPGSVNNVFRGCRAWFNSDDGYDCIRAAETVTFENCWAMYNGYNADFKNLGDGNGFKAGGWGLKLDERVPDSIQGHIIRFCVAVGNKANGFYSNHHPVGSYWLNNTAYRNSVNFNMLNRNAEFTEDLPGFGHTLINNLSFEPRNYDISQINYDKCTLQNNSFQLKLKLYANDFISLDEKLLVLPRNADGSLPNIDFMKSSKSSQVIDKGIDAGFPFKGKAPDLGAFER